MFQLLTAPCHAMPPCLTSACNEPLSLRGGMDRLLSLPLTCLILVSSLYCTWSTSLVHQLACPKYAKSSQSMLLAFIRCNYLYQMPCSSVVRMYQLCSCCSWCAVLSSLTQRKCSWWRKRESLRFCSNVSILLEALHLFHCAVGCSYRVGCMWTIDSRWSHVDNRSHLHLNHRCKLQSSMGTNRSRSVCFPKAMIIMGSCSLMSLACN